MNIEINRQLASQLGINPSMVDFILYDAFGQRVAARIYTRLNQYFVILEVEPDFQLGPNALSRIYATSSSGAEVPLSQFAAIASTVAPIADLPWPIPGRCTLKLRGPPSGGSRSAQR